MASSTDTSESIEVAKTNVSADGQIYDMAEPELAAVVDADLPFICPFCHGNIRFSTKVELIKHIDQVRRRSPFARSVLRLGASEVQS